jgi:hypothetical protein
MGWVCGTREREEKHIRNFDKKILKKRINENISLYGRTI